MQRGVIALLHLPAVLLLIKVFLYTLIFVMLIHQWLMAVALYGDSLSWEELVRNVKQTTVDIF